MKKVLLIVGLCAGLAGCGAARVAGDVAIGTGQVVLGAADLLV